VSTQKINKQRTKSAKRRQQTERIPFHYTLSPETIEMLRKKNKECQSIHRGVVIAALTGGPADGVHSREK